MGNDIYFNQGQYQPHTSEGKFLLAYELTHTLQQNASIGRKIQRLGDLSKVPTMACNVATSSSRGITVLSSLFTTSTTALSEAQVNELVNYVASWRARGGAYAIRIDGYASVAGSDEMNWQQLVLQWLLV